MPRFFRIRHRGGEGYQISGDYSVLLTDLDGKPISPTEYTTVEMDVEPPPWYVPPAPDPEPEPQPTERLITVYAFRARFTTDEKIALEAAAQGVPTASANDPRNVFAMRLRASEKDLQAARNVDLDMEATRIGTLALEQVGILAPGRALEILDAPVEAHERA